MAAGEYTYLRFNERFIRGFGRPHRLEDYRGFIRLDGNGRFGTIADGFNSVYEQLNSF